MDRQDDFDDWWDITVKDFEKLRHPLYKPLKALHARGGDPRYLLRLVMFFDKIERPFAKKTETTPRTRATENKNTDGNDIERLRPLAWWVVIEAMPLFLELGKQLGRDSLWRPSTLLTEPAYRAEWVKKQEVKAQEAFFKCLDDSSLAIERAIRKNEQDIKRGISERLDQLRENIQRSNQQVSELPLGNLIYRYKIQPLFGTKKPAATWDTFFFSPSLNIYERNRVNLTLWKPRASWKRSRLENKIL